jgi:hypothetical protein
VCSSIECFTGWLLDGGEHAQAAATAGAREHVELEDALERRCPGEVATAGVAGALSGRGGVFVGRHDRRAPRCSSSGYLTAASSADVTAASSADLTAI